MYLTECENGVWISAHDGGSASVLDKDIAAEVLRGAARKGGTMTVVAECMARVGLPPSVPLCAVVTEAVAQMNEPQRTAHDEALAENGALRRRLRAAAGVAGAIHELLEAQPIARALARALHRLTRGDG